MIQVKEEEILPFFILHFIHDYSNSQSWKQAL